MSETIKALTIRQPWASAVALGLKLVETRSWPTHHRGLLAIHAGAATDALSLLGDPRFSTLPPRGELPLGAVVAVAWLEAVDLMTPESIEAAGETERGLGDWSAGRYAWRFGGVVPITPASRPGALGLWSWETTPEAWAACRLLAAQDGRPVAAPPTKAKKCRVAGCLRSMHAQGFCATHYSSARTWIRRDRERRSWSSPELTARLAGGTTQ